MRNHSGSAMVNIISHIKGRKTLKLFRRNHSFAVMRSVSSVLASDTARISCPSVGASNPTKFIETLCHGPKCFSMNLRKLQVVKYSQFTCTVAIEHPEIYCTFSSGWEGNWGWNLLIISKAWIQSSETNVVPNKCNMAWGVGQNHCWQHFWLWKIMVAR